MKFHMLLCFLLVCVASTSSSSFMCHDFERSALLQFKQSFSIDFSASVDPSAYPKTQSWKPTGNGSDCCEWDGVECDEHTGHVLGLDLSSSCLYGSLPSISTLFELVHLQALNLSDNNFRYSRIPSRLGHLLNLKYLNMSQSRVYGQVPIEVSTLSNLISLDFSLNVEPSSGLQLLTLQHPNLATLVKNLTALEVLRLSLVNIPTPVPDIIANLTSLRILRFVNCGLHGLFPERIFLLPELQLLSLAYNTNLSGYFPEFQSNNKLNYMYIYNTEFYGQIPLSIGNLQSLKELDLSVCNFEGSIPVSLGQLSNLILLDLSFNNFVGEFPPSIMNLTRLSYLDLTHCNFRGHLPISLGKLSYLTHLGLSENSWIGGIPYNLSNLTQLSFLELYDSNLADEVPNFANLTKLIYLNLSNNRLWGSIGSFIYGLQNLGILILGHGNNFTGPLKFDMFLRHQNLQALALSDIQLTFPTSSHNTSYYPQFVMLELISCNLSRFPDFLHNQTRLSSLILRDNRIIGSLPVPPPSLVDYVMAANDLTGEIPTVICNATSLKILDLAFNKLSGRIPLCLFNLSNHLEILHFPHNYLHGTIPEAFTSSCELKLFGLGRNKIRGALPRSLTNCSSLQVLALGGNNIVDTFPVWLSGLPELQFVTLGSNKLYGPLPLQFGIGLEKLCSIQLSNNQLTGNMSEDFFANWYGMQQTSPQQSEILQTFNILGLEIPTESLLYETDSKNYQLATDYIHVRIDLSNNRLVGKIPNSIGNLRGVQILDLSYNNLTGGIPLSFGNLTNLVSLDLSHNMLSGEIPQPLTELSLLNHFNASYNQLTGPIPQGVQFDTFNNNSFIGNAGLCGSPLSHKCGNPKVQPAPQHEGHNSSSKGDEDSTDVIGWVIRSMGYLSGLVVGVIIGRIITDENHDWFVETFGRKQHKKKKKKQNKRQIR